MVSSAVNILFKILGIVILISMVAFVYKNEKTKIFIQKICSNPNLKKLGTIIIFMVPLYFGMAYFQILTDYLYLLEFVLIRLVLVSLFLILLQFLLELPFTKDFQAELQVFNQNPKGSPFLVLLRKYHFQLFLLAYISFGLATTYFVENVLISYVLGVVTFISVFLYLVQFIIYTKNYLQLQAKNFTYSATDTGKRYISTASGQTIKKVAVVCLECAKVGVQIGLGYEAGYKLTHGGMNDMSPRRQSAMNKMFPDDRTKIWTESKAAMAMHNRAMGYPHDNIYKTGDTIESVRNSITKLPKGKK